MSHLPYRIGPPPFRALRTKGEPPILVNVIEAYYVENRCYVLAQAETGRPWVLLQLTPLEGFGGRDLDLRHSKPVVVDIWRTKKRPGVERVGLAIGKGETTGGWPNTPVEADIVEEFHPGRV